MKIEGDENVFYTIFCDGIEAGVISRKPVVNESGIAQIDLEFYEPYPYQGTSLGAVRPLLLVLQKEGWKKARVALNARRMRVSL